MTPLNHLGVVDVISFRKYGRSSMYVSLFIDLQSESESTLAGTRRRRDKFCEISLDLVNRCQFGRNLLSVSHFCGFSVPLFQPC